MIPAPCDLTAEETARRVRSGELPAAAVLESVLTRLDAEITYAFHKVLKVSEREEVSMRDAAYMVAIGAVVEAMELRGWL